jgi:predicted oxidoreductase (fatty acid repression mutant protein)
MRTIQSQTNEAFNSQCDRTKVWLKRKLNILWKILLLIWGLR